MGREQRDVERRSPEATHPTLYASMGERVDYACVLGAYMAADEPLDPDDRKRLRELCHEIGLPPQALDKVLASVDEPPEKLRERLFRLRESTLRLMLVRDMVMLGFADGRYDVSERRRVRGLAALMLVGEDKIKRIEDEVVRELDAEIVLETRPPEEPDGAWAGVRRLYRRLMKTLSDE
jgi:uncharacterized tellurite resistance protein B-like protein